MVEKKRFLLRIDPELHAALERWAADDLRSINGQIEFVLKEALRTAGRLKERATDPYRTSEDDE
ncbi:toxin-antitoxin system HicB family antitoxin [Nannocystis pusilla]|uniref:toxin-antitoxin system HicB family antitoxin n=1 Tax=Nannocystis pusilla TaxID=889268 RepID=UPI003BF382E6